MSFPLSFSNFSSRPVAFSPLTKEFTSTHSLTQPLHPGWDMRQQPNFTSLPCPELWSALHAMLDLTPPAPSSLFSPVVFWPACSRHVRINTSSSFITFIRQLFFSPASSHRINTSSSFITVIRQLFFGRPLFLFPVGVNLKATLGTSHWASLVLNFEGHNHIFMPSVFLNSSSLVILLHQ